LKFKLFTDKLSERASGIVEKIGLAGSFIDYRFGAAEERRLAVVKNHAEAFALVAAIFAEKRFDLRQIIKVGHRVVHGGEEFVRPTLITPRVLIELKKFNKLAPLHNPNNLAGINACVELLPWAKNYAVFDTAFHATIPDYAYLYALPYALYKKYDIRRYGFHGISHAYVSSVAARKLKKAKPNLITCHLGSGCSITAVKQGKSVDTSMGFTPLEGLMMSSRSGDLDPAIVFYLEREGMSLNRVDEIMNFESGLKGVSGLKDMRDIMIASGYKIPGYQPSVTFTTEQKYLAQVALKMFVYRIRKYIGAYFAVLGKVDAIVFTAGVGERNADIRKMILKGLPFKARALVVPTNEELMIAREIIT